MPAASAWASSAWAAVSAGSPCACAPESISTLVATISVFQWRLPVVVPGAGLQAALERDLLALAEVAATGLGEAVPGDDRCGTPASPCPPTILVGGHGELGHRLAAGGGAELGVAGEATGEEDPVHRAACLLSTGPRGLGRLTRPILRAAGTMPAGGLGRPRSGLGADGSAGPAGLDGHRTLAARRLRAGLAHRLPAGSTVPESSAGHVEPRVSPDGSTPVNRGCRRGSSPMYAPIRARLRAIVDLTIDRPARNDARSATRRPVSAPPVAYTRPVLEAARAGPAMEGMTIARGRRGVRPVRRSRTFVHPVRRTSGGQHAGDVYP